MNRPVLVCPYCRSRVGVLRRVCCFKCRAAYHRECWAAQSGCSVFGCGGNQTKRFRLTFPVWMALIPPLLLFLYLVIGSVIALLERHITVRESAGVASSGMIWIHAALVGAGLFLIWIHDFDHQHTQ